MQMDIPMEISLRFQAARKVKEKFLLNFFPVSYESNFFFSVSSLLCFLNISGPYKHLDNSTFFCAVLKWCLPTLVLRTFYWGTKQLIVYGRRGATKENCNGKLEHCFHLKRKEKSGFVNKETEQWWTAKLNTNRQRKKKKKTVEKYKRKPSQDSCLS